MAENIKYHPKRKGGLVRKYWTKGRPKPSREISNPVALPSGLAACNTPTPRPAKPRLVLFPVYSSPCRYPAARSPVQCRLYLHSAMQWPLGLFKAGTSPSHIAWPQQLSLSMEEDSTGSLLVFPS